MTFVKTLLGTLALCAVLLAWVGYAVGPVRPGADLAGLTAAAVLASDGMGPDGRVGEPGPGRAVPRDRAGAMPNAARGTDDPTG